MNIYVPLQYWTYTALKSPTQRRPDYTYILHTIYYILHTTYYILYITKYILYFIYYTLYLHFRACPLGIVMRVVAQPARSKWGSAIT